MRRAVFLDRDGVINAMWYDPEHGVVDSPGNPEQFNLLPGVAEAIGCLNRAGWPVVVVSNQPGIAKGRFTPGLLEAMDRKMGGALAERGARLDAVLYCLHHPAASVESYREECGCRKPRPGLLLRAAAEMGLQLEGSYMVGDGLADVQAGRAAGCRTVLLGQQKCYVCSLIAEMDARPDFVVPDLPAAVRLIQELEGLDADLHR